MNVDEGSANPDLSFGKTDYWMQWWIARSLELGEAKPVDRIRLAMINGLMRGAPKVIGK